MILDTQLGTLCHPHARIQDNEAATRMRTLLIIVPEEKGALGGLASLTKCSGLTMTFVIVISAFKSLSTSSHIGPHNPKGTGDYVSNMPKGQRLVIFGE